MDCCHSTLVSKIMEEHIEYIVNSVGRRIPKKIEGYGVVVPFSGAFGTAPPEKGAHVFPRFYQPRRSKMCNDLKEALIKCGVKDGMVISFNHHLRNGDVVVEKTMAALKELAVKNIVLFASALFDCHASLIPYVDDGTIGQIMGSMNGPLGRHISLGYSSKPAILRSHGGRAAAITLGKVVIDICIVQASCSDSEGNCSGLEGKNPVGGLGYSEYEIPFARRAIVVTDTLMPYPLTPPQITLNFVDYVVKVESIGSSSGIATGTVQPSRKVPEEQMKNINSIAEYVTKVVLRSGILRDGVVFLGGSGQASMKAMREITAFMDKEGIVGAQLNGGTTASSVNLLKRGVIRQLTTAQAFDMTAVKSMADDYPNHIDSDCSIYYNPFTCGCTCHLQDFTTVSATEVDIDFNVNVNTHSDGYLLHGIGGHQDNCAGTRIVIVTCPLARKNNPIIIPSVTTVSTPGECIDVVATEAGIAVNPHNKELVELLTPYKDELNIKTITELARLAAEKAGQDYQPPKLGKKIIAVVEWRDQTVLDVIYEVLNGSQM